MYRNEYDIKKLASELVKVNRDDIQINENVLKYLILEARNIFLNEPMLLELNAPIRICGDIHGQFRDLLRLFEVGGFPPQSSYVFLGDYVDRGKYSIETMTLLLCYKVIYPEKFFLLRGNHECESMNRLYGFHNECREKFSVHVWKMFIELFNCMPVAAVIENKVFCCHGGLSPHLKRLEQIKRIRRPTDIPKKGLLCDLLWSDPGKTICGWSANDRGISYKFGSNVVQKFCKTTNLELVVRAHQVVDNGYEFFANKKLVTLFSAPNYCHEAMNYGAIMFIDKSLICSFQILPPQM